jgi:hypothetical protein
MVFRMPSWRYETAVVLLHSPEKFHNTSTEKSIRLFTDGAIHEVTQ